MPLLPESTKRHQEITKPRLLLGEGKDEVAFFQALLTHLGLDQIQVMEYHGKHGIRRGLATIVKLPGFATVQSIGITRDADHFANLGSALLPQNRNVGEAIAAFDSICATLRTSEIDLPVPDAPLQKGNELNKPTVSIFILPDCIHPGMLEDLCLQALADHPAMICIDGYFSCITAQSNYTHPPHKKAKAFLRAWLACQTEPDLILGQAAEKGYWNFEHPAFDQLKQFILNL